MFQELGLREGWITVFCLLLMQLCVAWAIQAAHWTDGLAILQGLVLAGGVLGIVLAKSRTPNRLSHLLSLLAGITWAITLTSQVLARANGLSGILAVSELQARLYGLFVALATEGASADNYVFLLLLAFLMWVIAYFGAWAVFRWQQVWWAVIVSGVALLLNINYTTENLTLYVILFLLFALLLVVRASVAYYEQEWRAARVGYSPELIAGFLRAGLILSVLLITLAWLAPEALASRPLQPFWDKLAEPWRDFQDRSSRLFQDLDYQNEPPLVSLGERRMWFGGPVNLSDTPIADVEAQTGRYWRVLVFHDYTGDGWVSTDPDIILIGENEQDLAFPELELRFEMTQTVTLYRDWDLNSSLVAAAQPLRAGLPLRAAVTFIQQQEDVVRAPDASSFPSAPGDPSALYPRERLVAGAAYQVLSSLTEVDEESLRQAGTSYPSWVVPRYLQLPESFPERVKLLAAQVTEGLNNPYDQAKAIEQFLRRFPYNDQIEGPGRGEDGVDYFLFDEQAGYCDYYASAMVTMLRSLDVPARYVRGYSEGRQEEGIYHLLESDGHAWPEVFFPGYGWIEFEPTGGEPPLSRPESQDGEEAAEPTPLERSGPGLNNLQRLEDELNPDLSGSASDLDSQPFWRKIRPVGWTALALVLVGVVTVTVFGVQRQRRLEGLSVAERVYEDLVDWVRRLLRIEPLSHQTPNEYAGVVGGHIPRGRQAIEQIAGLYVEERFSDRSVSAGSAEEAWQQAWPAIWRSWFERRLEGVKRFWWRFVPPKASDDL
jgi:transglutaminase-like putative cysteine protease